MVNNKNIVFSGDTSQTEDKSPKKASQSTKVALTLGGLAIIATAIILIAKRKKVDKAAETVKKVEPGSLTKEEESIVAGMQEITKKAEAKYGLFKNYLGEDKKLRDFFELELPSERIGKTRNTINAIMIQGNDESSIDEVIEIIPKMTDVNVSKVSHNPEKPDDTIEKLYEEAEKAEQKFKETKKSTILQVNGLSDLLSDSKSDEGERRIADFKLFVQDCAKDYHTTLLFKILNPEKVDAASIAPHRVGIRLEINKKG